MPREAFEAKALFQMKFYALVLWRTRGVVASQLKLIYLGGRRRAHLRARRGRAGPLRAHAAGDLGGDRAGRRHPDFRPNRTRLCDWCDHQALCPPSGGTPPPFPAEAAAAAGWATLPVVERDWVAGRGPLTGLLLLGSPAAGPWTMPTSR